MIIVVCLFTAFNSFAAAKNSSTPKPSTETQSPLDDEIAKLVESYVLAANFDDQISSGSLTPAHDGLDRSALDQDPVPAKRISFESDLEHFDDEVIYPKRAVKLPSRWTGNAEDRYGGPGWPVQYAPLASEKSVFAVGFITFLILLLLLHNNLMMMMRGSGAVAAAPPQSTSLLGGVTQSLGRRRRHAGSFPTIDHHIHHYVIHK